MSRRHITIGSGIKGQAGASLLALKGEKVLLLEREAVAASRMPTEELTPGDLHDVMAAPFVLFMTASAGAARFLFALMGGRIWSWSTAKVLFGQLRKGGPRGLAAWFGQQLDPIRCLHPPRTGDGQRLGLQCS